MKCLLLSIVATCVVAISIPANATVIAINNHDDAYVCTIWGAAYNDPYGLPVGAGSNWSIHQFNMVYVFELPTLASNQVVASADLTFQYTYRNFMNFNVDLWGIGFQNSTTPIIEFFNQNTGDSGNTKIEDNVILQSMYPSTISTGAAGDAVLGSYIQSFYDATPGYSGGDYVFLRLNHDTLPGSAAFINVSQAADSNTVLTLDITTNPVPEPSTLAIWSLLALCGIGYGWRRRKT